MVSSELVCSEVRKYTSWKNGSTEAIVQDGGAVFVNCGE